MKHAPLIDVRDVAKVYTDDGVETVALRDVNLTIAQGEFVAIIGPSGSGKSTLLQILGCLDRPTAGQYFFEGKEVQSYTDNELAVLRNKNIGFIFQAFNLLPRLSVFENVKLPLVYSGVRESERARRARELITTMGLSDRAEYQALKLSGGQKQRVAIARALINAPQVIFADEPTGSLDSKSGEVVLRSLEELHHRGNTVVLVTHESYVAAYAERVVHIKDGMIEKDERVTNPHTVARDGFTK